MSTLGRGSVGSAVLSRGEGFVGGISAFVGKIRENTAERVTQSREWKRVGIEMVVVLAILAIPSKIILDIRTSDLQYVSNTRATRVATANTIKRGQALQKNESQYKATQSQDALMIPQSVGYSSIVSTMTTIASDAGVTLISISAPGKVMTTIAGSVHEWSINATVEGTYAAIQSYINMVQNQPRLYQVQQVQIAVSTVGVSSGGAQTLGGQNDNAVVALDMESLR